MDLTELVTLLSSPVILTIAGFWWSAKQKKESSAREEVKSLLKVISDTQSDLIKKIDDLEEYKASKKTLEVLDKETKASLKEIWHTFRTDQVFVSRDLGHLFGALEITQRPRKRSQESADE